MKKGGILRIRIRLKLGFEELLFEKVVIAESSFAESWELKKRRNFDRLEFGRVSSHFDLSDNLSTHLILTYTYMCKDYHDCNWLQPVATG